MTDRIKTLSVDRAVEGVKRSRAVANNTPDDFNPTRIGPVTKPGPKKIIGGPLTKSSAKIKRRGR